MVAALLLLSAGPALSGDFAGTLPTHSHVFLGAPHAPHSHSFDPDGGPSGDTVNVTSSEAGAIALGITLEPPVSQETADVDGAPWLHLGPDTYDRPGDVVSDLPVRPPIS